MYNMQPHNMSDINPLDLLATAAASLESANTPLPCSLLGHTSVSETSSLGSYVASSKTMVESEKSNKHIRKMCTDVEREDELSCEETKDVKVQDSELHKVPCTQKVVGKNRSVIENLVSGRVQVVAAPKSNFCSLETSVKSVITMKDATKFVLHNNQTGKNLTVFKLNTQQMPDHSYAFLGKMSQDHKTNSSLPAFSRDCGPDSSKSNLKEDSTVAEAVNSDECVINENGVRQRESSKSLILESKLPEKTNEDESKKNVVLRALLGGSTAVKPYKLSLSRNTQCPSAKSTSDPGNFSNHVSSSNTNNQKSPVKETVENDIADAPSDLITSDRKSMDEIVNFHHTNGNSLLTKEICESIKLCSKRNNILGHARNENVRETADENTVCSAALVTGDQEIASHTLKHSKINGFAAKVDVQDSKCEPYKEKKDTVPVKKDLSTTRPLMIHVQSDQGVGKTLSSPVLVNLNTVSQSVKTVLHRDSVDSGIEKDGESLQTSDYETDTACQQSSSDELGDATASSDSEVGSCIVSPKLPSDADSIVTSTAVVRDNLRAGRLSAGTNLMSPPVMQYVVKTVKGSQKTVIPIHKYQYIIEDDIPPTSKFDKEQDACANREFEKGEVVTKGVHITAPSSVGSTKEAPVPSMESKSSLLLVNQPQILDVSKSLGKKTVKISPNTSTHSNILGLTAGRLPPGTQLLLAKPVAVSAANKTILQIAPATAVPKPSQGIICKPAATSAKGKVSLSNTLLLPKLSNSTILSASVLPEKHIGATSELKDSESKPVSQSLLSYCTNTSDVKAEDETENVDVVGDLDNCSTRVENDMRFALPFQVSSFAPIKNETDSNQNPAQTNTNGIPGERADESVDQWTVDCPLSGRVTPSLLGSSLDRDSPGEKISVKIASSRIVEVTTPEPVSESEPSHSPGECKSASIGTLGSISLKNLNDQIDADAKDTKHLSSLYFQSRKSPVTASVLSEQLVKKMKQSAISSPANITVGSTIRTKRPYNRKKTKFAKVPVQNVSQTNESYGNLHPLIDHDYCAFTSFSAVVQSSIIATTELKFFKKNSKKKVCKAKIEPDTQESSSGSTPQKFEPSEVDAGTVRSLPKVHPITETQSKKLGKRYKRLKKFERKKLMKDKRKAIVQSATDADKDDKDYVKITGSFQDDFVYYATKNYRGKPRKFKENGVEVSQILPQGKVSAVGGLSVFDWYKDLSKADKSSKFGLLESSAAASCSVNRSGVTSLHAPLHDTDVVDLVYEMEMESESNSNMEVGVSSSGNVYSGGKEESSGSLSFDSDQVSSVFRAIDGVLKDINPEGKPPSANEGKGANNDDSGIFSPVCSTPSQICTVNQNGEVETSIASAGSMPMNTLLSSYVEDPSENNNTQLCDLDEINDSDLFSGDLNNMSDLLGEVVPAVSSSAVSVVGSNVSTYSQSSYETLLDGKREAELSALDRIKNGLVSGTDGISAASSPNENFADYGTIGLCKGSLDRSELFPDMSQPEPTIMNDVIVPELTVVSMYWNDLPGLVINGTKYVRLVDIHKQMLPAKDTGILKKRCQMLGLEIANCTEMQRDFLIRYANAAKSKSCVITTKEAAEALIGFYVEPRMKTGGKASSRHIHAAEDERPQKTGTDGRFQPNSRDSSPDAIPERRGKRGKSGGKSKTGGKTGGKTSGKTRKRTLSVDESAKERVAKAVVLPAESPIKRSERLRHCKKVAYAKLHEGTMESKNSPSKGDNSSLKPLQDNHSKLTSEHPTPVKSKVPVVIKVRMGERKRASCSSRRKLEYQKNQCAAFEKEICQLKSKARKRSLGSRERQRFLRLKEKVKLLRREIRMARRESVELQSKKGFVRKTKTSMKAGNKGVTSEEIKSSGRSNTEEGQLSSNEDTSVKAKMDIANKPCKEAVEEKILHVIHMDVGCRSVHRARTQGGLLHLHLYNARYSRCVQCSVCKEMLSLYKFMKHYHRSGDPNELYAVTLPQKLEMSVQEPSQNEGRLWKQFEEMRSSYEHAEQEPEKTEQNPSGQDHLKSCGTTADAQTDLVADTDSQTSDTVPPSAEVLSSAEADEHSKAKLDAEQTFSVLKPAKEKVEVSGTFVGDKPNPSMVNPDACNKKSVLKQGCSSTHENGPSVVDSEKMSDLKSDIKSRVDLPQRSKRTKSASDHFSLGKQEVGTRHSTRVRKRKQYHPMESFVFSQAQQSGMTSSKLAKLEETSRPASSQMTMNESPIGVSREV